MVHLGDITKIKGAEIEPVDVITGGSPCQDLSVAGKRAGLAGKRSGLFMEQIRIVKEMREHDRSLGRTDDMARPRFMVWENVPGAFSSNKGQDFVAVLEETIKVIEPEAPAVPVPDRGWPTSGCLYDELGRWSVAWRVHDAQFWGVPQRRRRIALVADFGGLAAPEVLFERKGLRGDTAAGEEAREKAADGVGGCIDKTICIAGNAVDREARQNGSGIKADGTSFTLNTVDRHAVCAGFKAGQSKAGGIGWQKECAATLSGRASGMEPTVMVGTLCTRDYKGVGNQYVDEGKLVFPNQIVRRLTPLECERLQGFPDGWTDIGAWMDSNGKLHTACSDSARYRALGNSIALPFWKWLMKRISAQYERDATLGSLFDGIGGFPLAWEHCNGKGSARWASEIEEFPMAVTKYHFEEE